MSKIYVKLIHSDKDKREIYTKVNSIVKLVVAHKDLIQLLCYVVSINRQVDSLEKIDRRGNNSFQKYLERWIKNHENDKEYIAQFAEEIKDIYNSCRIISGSNKQKEYLDSLRGAILEELIYYLVTPRYNSLGKLFQTGCTICLNGENLVTNKRVSVDIAGWDNMKLNGEFYEVKVGPYYFDSDVLNLLSLIKNKFENINIDVIVGCISMDTKDKLVEQIEEVSQSEEVINYNTNIILYGREDILDIINNPFPISA